jgi:hypothetical protein
VRFSAATEVYATNLRNQRIAGFVDSSYIFLNCWARLGLGKNARWHEEDRDASDDTRQVVDLAGVALRDGGLNSRAAASPQGASGISVDKASIGGVVMNNKGAKPVAGVWVIAETKLQVPFRKIVVSDDQELAN